MCVFVYTRGPFGGRRAAFRGRKSMCNGSRTKKKSTDDSQPPTHRPTDRPNDRPTDRATDQPTDRPTHTRRSRMKRTSSSSYTSSSSSSRTRITHTQWDICERFKAKTDTDWRVRAPQCTAHGSRVCVGARAAFAVSVRRRVCVCVRESVSVCVRVGQRVLQVACAMWMHQRHSGHGYGGECRTAAQLSQTARSTTMPHDDVGVAVGTAYSARDTRDGQSTRSGGLWEGFLASH